MRIVFLTNQSSHGLEILKHFQKKNIELEAIVVEVPESRVGLRKKIGRLVQKHGVIKACMLGLSRTLLKIKRIWKPQDTVSTYQQYAKQILFVENFNSKESEQKLKELRPDLVILGGARILKKNIIAIPRIGILNAHPGLLPKYRGMDVIPWAVLNRDDVGVTVHFIDERIDAGKICAQRKIEIEPTDTLETLSRKAEVIAGELMAEVVEKLIRDGSIETYKPKKIGRLFHKMDKNTRKKAEKVLKEIRNEKRKLLC
jgi:methionyl-tRNA formyltransferase